MMAVLTPDDYAPQHVRLLLAIRKQQKLSQGQLAAELGVSERTVRRWECGDLEPPLLAVLALRWVMHGYKQGDAA